MQKKANNVQWKLIPSKLQDTLLNPYSTIFFYILFLITGFYS